MKKVPLWLFVTWKALEGIAWVVAMPIWLPLLCLAYPIVKIVEAAHDWYIGVKTEWMEGQ